jgi:hypothetical protein
MKKTIIIAALLTIFKIASYGQDAESKGFKPEVKVTTDIVSSYIWRGTVGSMNPNIQPTLAAIAGGFELGVWGSTDLKASYKELDPYLAYTKGSFKVMVTDYDWTFANASYFDYKKSSTDHIIEASLCFLGTDKLPLSIAVNTMIYGADKKWDKTLAAFSSDQNYSTYIELGYTFEKCNVFLGMTPSNGYYGAGYGKVDGFAICNMGVSSVRNLKVSPDFEIPLKGTLIVNPQAESIHFVIGITL